jgi:acetyl-CoA carboxylase carboxyltransferase component
MRNLPDLLYTRAAHISHVVFNVSIIYNSCIADNSYRPAMRYIVIINTRAINIGLWRTYPVIIGHIVTASYGYADADARL